MGQLSATISRNLPVASHSYFLCGKLLHGVLPKSSLNPFIFLLLPEPHCPKPAVDHGREAYNSKNDYTVGTKVRIECDEGYTLSTQQLVTCQADGNWFPSLPYCQKGTCKAGAVISTGAGQAAFLQHHPWGAGR